MQHYLIRLIAGQDIDFTGKLTDDGRSPILVSDRNLDLPGLVLAAPFLGVLNDKPGVFRIGSELWALLFQVFAVPGE